MIHRALPMDATSPYASAAADYRRAGWSPVPVTPGKKSPPLPGLTGAGGRDLSPADVASYVETHPNYGVAIRMPVGVVGLDIDQYGTKRGADALETFRQEKGLGELPWTIRSSARPYPSGIRYFRLPDALAVPDAAGEIKVMSGSELRLTSAPVPGVEVIQHHHRFAMVWPTLHPDLGTAYEWAWSDGHGPPVPGGLPSPNDLAELPAEWVIALGAHLDEAIPADNPRPIPRLEPEAGWDPSVRRTHADGLEALAAAASGGGRHDAGCAHAMALARLESLGDAGSTTALALVGDAFVAAVTAPGDNQRTELAARAEWDDLVSSGRRLAATTKATRPTRAELAEQQRQERLALAELVIVPDAVTSPDLPVAVGPDGRRYNDLGNSKRLLDAHGHRVRFVPAWKRWLTWDDRRWAADHDRVHVAELAQDAVQRLLLLRNEVQGEARKALINFVIRSESAAGIRNLIEVARSNPRIAVDHRDLDADPWLLNVRNGVVDLRTGLLYTPDSKRLVTKLAGCTYAPDAAAPSFDRFLVRSLPDPEVRAYLQRWAGYCLTADVSEQVLGLWCGPGRNGKSTLLRILSAALGDYAVTVGRELVMSQKFEGHDTKFVPLHGARLAISGELKEGEEIDASRVKLLTGGDTIQARRMREDHWTFKPTHKFVIATNFPPRANAADFALWRRLQIVAFDQIIPEREVDPHLADRIIDEELTGVLAWMVRGCMGWQAEGLAPPDAVLVATQEYRGGADTVAAFIRDAGITYAPGLRVASQDLQEAHSGWCADAGENPNVHWQKVQARLKAEGASPQRGHGGRRHWQGVGLADREERDAG